MNTIEIEAGSYRDPAGKIFYRDNRVYRILKKEGINRFEFLKKNNLLENLIKKNFLIETREVDNNDIKIE